MSRDECAAADTRIIEDAYGGWTHSREDIAAEIAERDAAPSKAALVLENIDAAGVECATALIWLDKDGYSADLEVRRALARLEARLVQATQLLAKEAV